MGHENPQEDAVLAIRCQLGEHDAWVELVARWHPRLWRFVRRMLTNQSTAEDVLQTIWLRIVRSMVQLEHPEALAAWLYRIARLAIADQLREQYRRPPAELLIDVESDDDAMQSLDVSDSVEKGLSHLHPTDREALVLYYFEQRSVKEVAEICGVPPGTIKSRLHRARTSIRKALIKEEEYD